MNLSTITAVLFVAMGAVSAIAGSALYAIAERPQGYAYEDRQQLDRLVKEIMRKPVHSSLGK